MTTGEYINTVKRIIGWLVDVQEEYAKGFPENENGYKPTLSIGVYPAKKGFDAYASAFCFIEGEETIHIGAGDKRVVEALEGKNETELPDKSV